MRLSDIFDALGSGELANLHLVENNSIIPGKLPIVLNAINLALTDLHTKFLLKRELIKINIEPTIETYKITNGDFIEVLNSDMNGIQYSLLNPNTLYVKADKPTVVTIEYKASHRKLTEEDILKASQVKVTMTVDEYLRKFFGLYWNSSQLLAIHTIRLRVQECISSSQSTCFTMSVAEDNTRTAQRTESTSRLRTWLADPL